MGTIMTVLGTRPEIIRLSRIIPKLDGVCNHILVHTGQNYDSKLSDVFFEDLQLRQPNHYLGAKGSMGKQMGMILEGVEKLIDSCKPDKLLILGDTNSGLAAIVSERKRIPVYHMEAGNRCYDNEVPEEINRKIIDHVSTYNFPYTPNSEKNLLKEGLDSRRIIRSGNPIYEVLKYYKSEIESSKILKELKINKYRYFLSTFHRAECVDKKERLQEIILGLEKIYKQFKLPIICSIHPRTRSKLNKWNIKSNFLTFLEPIRFFDFVKLEKYADGLISDSGTCCEEGTILRTPTVICRNTTERPETVKVGSAMVSGINANNIVNNMNFLVQHPIIWDMPIGYIDNNVSNKILKYLLGRIK